MKLLEYEAKNILDKFGIAIPRSVLVTPNNTPSLTLPVVLKSQVPTGGRGKAGGIKIVENMSDIASAVDGLFKLPIEGYLPSCLLAEEKLSIAHEFYLSVIVNRSTNSIELLAHTQGGVEVEGNSEGGYWKVATGKWSKDKWGEVGESLAEYYNLPEKTFVLQDMVQALYKCFTQNDATLIEINPLVLTADNRLVAGDCKIELDDAAAFRHPEWDFEQKITAKNFVTIDPNGTVATIANGAGLAMATVDAVADYGMRPANFLDIGGGANSATILAAFNQIMEYKQVKAIIINIFAGITRCDEVARAIITARQQINNLPPLFIRLSGTNADQAKQLLDSESISLLPTLETCLQAAKAKVDRG